jgi:hypothetical protein
MVKADGREGQTSSKSRMLTNNGSRYCLSCLPRQTVEFPKSGLKHVTNERYNTIQTAGASSIYAIAFMLFWSILLSDELKETGEQSEKYKSLRDKISYD